MAGAVAAAGCRTAPKPDQPVIEFTRIPQADVSGSDKHDIIEGAVKGAIAFRHRHQLPSPRK